MFEKILIANRGEIACRVIKTARRMGIATVAVHSDADATGLHVEMADEAVRLGPAPAAQSYLDIDAVIAACRETGAEAVHPGYGFLSENAAFARRLEKEGIIFIGPPPAAIDAMGDKIESKRVATQAGVSTVPGHDGIVADEDEAATIARQVGFPVMLKASAGGGGKGMRIAHDEGEAREGFRLARSEAASSFGDDRVFIERFIEEPRHIEIQVLADAHGNCVHLGERECSIQRRNQKVIEEAPSPFLDAETRAAMGAQAVSLAAAVGYVSAGTVEFIVDAERNFYFLEMNTRLQVEHPVTELVTGRDLVEDMIRIAAGEALSLAQEDLRLEGHALEARVYAEDPFRGFLPSIGRLARFVPPEENRRDGVTVRLDTGVVEGSEISVFYDPMIAKLVTHAPTRDAAIDAMALALDGFAIQGIGHNVPFLSALMGNARFREGRLSTAFIAQEYPDGFAGAASDLAGRRTLAAIAATAHALGESRYAKMTGRLDGAPPAKSWVVRSREWSMPVTLAEGRIERPLDVELEIDGQVLRVASVYAPGDIVWRGMVGDQEERAAVSRNGHAITLTRDGAVTVLRVLSPLVAAIDDRMPEKAPPDTSKLLLCPMPGVVTALHVEEGQAIEIGQPVATVEAMKMENVLRAERAGTVAALEAAPGDSLSVDQVIARFE